MYYVLDGLPPLSEREPIGPLIEFPLFFGTTLFAIEAVGVVSDNNNDKWILLSRQPGRSFKAYHLFQRWLPWRTTWKLRNHSAHASVCWMLVCLSSHCCMLPSVYLVTWNMALTLAKVLHWICPAGTCEWMKVGGNEWTSNNVRIIFIFQHHQSCSINIHLGHIHLVRFAMLCSGWNHLDHVFVETLQRSIEMGIRCSNYNCYHHV